MEQLNVGLMLLCVLFIDINDACREITDIEFKLIALYPIETLSFVSGSLESRKMGEVESIADVNLGSHV